MMRQLFLPSGITTKSLQPNDQPTDRLNENFSANSYTPELEIQS